MLTILDKSAFDEVKPQMQLRVNNIKSQLKHLENREKKGGYVSCNQVNQLEKDLKIYSSKYVLPTKFEGLIINYKLFIDFIKKIKKFDIQLEIEDGNLIVKYRDIRGINGVLHLCDISSYYQDIQGIPEIEFKTYTPKAILEWRG